MATSAMYYPHIHFRSRSWLRSALLYYETITRIVPEGMVPDTVDEYARFTRDAEALVYEVNELKAAGFIRNQPPDSKAVTQTANEFLDFASDNLTDPIRRAAVLPALRRRNPYISLHPSNIDAGLVGILKDLGLAHEKISDPYYDWDIDAATAVLYLMHLSINQSKGRPLITDNALYQKLLYSDAVSLDDERSDKPDGSFLLVAAAFENIVPVNLDEIPLRELLKFREKHGTARYRFQDQIAILAKKLSEAKDENELAVAVSSQTAIIEEEKQLLEEKLLGHNFDWTSAILSISVPSFVAYLAPKHPVVTAGAVAACMSARYFKFSLERKGTKTSHPYSYLLDVKNFLSAREFAKNLVTLGLGENDGYDERPRAM